MLTFILHILNEFHTNLERLLFVLFLNVYPFRPVRHFAWPSTQQSVNRTEINVLMFCLVTNTTTCINLYYFLQFVV
jgi:hypothetical protein